MSLFLNFEDMNHKYFSDNFFLFNSILKIYLYPYIKCITYSSNENIFIYIYYY